MDINTTFGYWLTVATFARFSMERYTRPEFVGEKRTPENLNQLTIGQLIELSEVGDTNESLYRVTETVMGMQREETDRARAVDVVRLVGWVFGEVEKINKLFNQTKTNYTQRERQAGVEKLQFGLFGMLDWYARRMGIENHDDVLRVPWMRIYKCLDMDTKQSQYERRLNEIAAQELRTKRR